jgi:hypothetical protein
MIEDLLLFDIEGVIQLTDQHCANDKIIADAAQHQGYYAGENIYTAIMSEQLHGSVSLYPMP